MPLWNSPIFAKLKLSLSSNSVLHFDIPAELPNLFTSDTV